MQHSEQDIHVTYTSLPVYGHFTLPYTRGNYNCICNYTRPVGGDKQYAQMESETILYFAETSITVCGSAVIPTNLFSREEADDNNSHAKTVGTVCLYMFDVL